MARFYLDDNDLYRTDEERRGEGETKDANQWRRPRRRHCLFVTENLVDRFRFYVPVSAVVNSPRVQG